MRAASLPAVVGDVDPVLVTIVAVMLLVVFVVYLYVRRVVVGFREGLERGRR